MLITDSIRTRNVGAPLVGKMDDLKKGVENDVYYRENV